MPSLKLSPEVQREIDAQTAEGEPHGRLANFTIIGIFARRKQDRDRACPECVEGVTIARGNVPEGLQCARCNATGQIGGPTAACLRHRGLDAIAVARRANERELLIGECHGIVTVDEFRWGQLTERERKAVVDHELTHFERSEDGENLSIRQHDWEAFDQTMRDELVAKVTLIFTAALAGISAAWRCKPVGSRDYQADELLEIMADEIKEEEA